MKRVWFIARYISIPGSLVVAATLGVREYAALARRSGGDGLTADQARDAWLWVLGGLVAGSVLVIFDRLYAEPAATGRDRQLQAGAGPVAAFFMLIPSGLLAAGTVGAPAYLLAAAVWGLGASGVGRAIAAWALIVTAAPGTCAGLVILWRLGRLWRARMEIQPWAEAPAPPASWRFGTLLGLGIGDPPEPFPARDGNARREAEWAWRWMLLWGVLWCAGAWVLVYWGWRGITEPGWRGVLP